MTEVPLRVRVDLDKRRFDKGIGEMVSQSLRASVPIKKAFVGVKKELDKAGTSAKKLGTEGKKAGDKIKRSMSGGAFAIRGIATEMESALRGLVFAIGAVTAAGGLLGRQAVNMSAEFEVLTITFETLTGSVEQADMLIRDMKEFAVKTPLQLKDIEQAGTTLLALGEAAEDVIPILDRLGQAAVAMNLPLEQFIRARNLLAQGIVLSRTLAPLGISRDILTEYGAGPDATGAELVTAFDKALGRFEGLFERTFDTIRGRLSNLKDEMDVMFAAMGDPMRNILISTVDQITAFLGEVRTFFEQNSGLIEESFRRIKAAAEDYIKPVTDLLGGFLNKIKENPEYILVLTDAFINMAKAVTNLLIIGTLTTAFVKFVATITLLKLSLPVVLRTFGFMSPAVVKLTTAVKGLNVSIISTRLAILGLEGAFVILSGLALAIVPIITAWNMADDALKRYQQRLMGVQAGMHVATEAEMSGISTLRGVGREGQEMSDAEKAAAARLWVTSGGVLGINPRVLGIMTGPPAPTGVDALFPSGGGAGGAGAAAAIKERTGAELAKWLRDLARNMPPVVEAFDNIRDSLIKEREARDALIEYLKEEKRLHIEKLRLQRELELSGYVDLIRGRSFVSGISGFSLTSIEGLMGTVVPKDLPEDMESTFDNFIRDLSGVFGDLIEQWGWTGETPGKQDMFGIAQGLLQGPTQAWGGNLASWLGVGASFGNPLGAMISGGMGFLGNLLFGGGESPTIQIKQPVDIRIVDIETRLKNWFNMRGMDSFAYGSSFRSAFEKGLY